MVFGRSERTDFHTRLADYIRPYVRPEDHLCDLAAGWEGCPSFWPKRWPASPAWIRTPGAGGGGKGCGQAGDGQSGHLRLRGGGAASAF